MLSGIVTRNTRMDTAILAQGKSLELEGERETAVA